MTDVDPGVYSTTYRVRFDEAAPDGRLRTSTLLRYAQDLAWVHSDEVGFTREWYDGRGFVWLARAASVSVVATARTADVLTGTTRVLGSRRVWARRRTDFSRPDGTPVGWTVVDWVLLDASGRPTRIPPSFDAAFGQGPASLVLARVELPEPADDADVSTFVVRPQELDPMDHVNNAVYADWLEERVLAAAGTAGTELVRALPRTARLEYARAAEPATTVRAWTWREGTGAWACLMRDPAGNDLLRARLEPGSA